MRRILLVLTFFVGNSLLLLISGVYLGLTMSGKTASPAQELYARSYQAFNVAPQVLGVFSDAAVVAADARPGLVDQFLEKYRSPFHGLGQFIVDAADKHQIPYGLVPAIAQCESNVGKTVPYESYNAWGYGVYGGSVLRFNSWSEAIERVSRGLREDYFDLGLNTPEKIMKKYTPPSRGSWARCVNQFLAELQ